MLASSGGSSPIADMYAAISDPGESQSIDIQLYFPHARQPLGKSYESQYTIRHDWKKSSDILCEVIGRKIDCLNWMKDLVAGIPCGL